MTDCESPKEETVFIKAVNLPPQYQKGYDFINDPGLADVTIGIVPDEAWEKGDQPSESRAEQGIILFKKSYYEGNDDIGWMVHELSHCQRYKNEPDTYQKDSGNTYPDNKVEAFTFSQQFKYLKEQGKTREEITEMLVGENGDYKKTDMLFFNKLLDQVFIA